MAEPEPGTHDDQDTFAELFGGEASDAEEPQGKVKKDKKDKKEKKAGKEGKEGKEKKEKKDKKEKKESKSTKQEPDAAPAEAEAKVEADVPPAEPERNILKIRKKGRTSAAAASPAVAAVQPEDKKDKKDKKRKGVDPDADDAAPAPTDVMDELMAEGDFMENVLQDLQGSMEPPSEQVQAGEVFEDFQDDALEAGDALAGFMEDLGQEMPIEEGDQPREDVPVLIPPKFGSAKKRKTVAATGSSMPVARHGGYSKEGYTTHSGPIARNEGEESMGLKLNGVMDSLKLKRPLSITERDSMTFIENFVQEMVEAAENDLREFESGKGAALKNKMNLLGKAVSVMQKFVFGELFVTYGGCRALALWLRSLPDGSLPNAHLRTTLLNAMLRLPISKEALQNCKEPALGEIVQKLMKNPNETVDNRKTAGSLVQKWLKQVLVKSASASLESEDAGEGPQALHARKPAETLESFLALEEDSFKRIHPTIPVREGKEYVVHPEPAANALPQKRDKFELDSNRYKLNEVLKVFNRPNKKGWKPYEVSIGGKGLNQL